MMSGIIPIIVNAINCHQPERPVSCKRRDATLMPGKNKARFRMLPNICPVPITASRTPTRTPIPK